MRTRTSRSSRSHRARSRWTSSPRRRGVEHVQVGGDLTELLDASEPDLVLNAVVGFAGVGATLWALERGVTLALANKESLVAAGDLAVAAWKRGGGLLLPVDSEHSAVFQCLEGRAPETIDSLVLTASGGPFRNRPLADLESVSVEEALAHPTWSMGPKITIDSATLANKGLELIEAHYLFEAPYERIDVVVHPTSVVHSLVRFRDGAALAHVGYPDMRVPISFALTYPERRATPVPALDLTTPLSLEFEPPDPERFPLLPLAREAGERGGTYPARSTPRTRSPSRRSSTSASASSRSRRSSRMRSTASTGAPRAISRELVEAGRRRRGASPREGWRAA